MKHEKLTLPWSFRNSGQNIIDRDGLTIPDSIIDSGGKEVLRMSVNGNSTLRERERARDWVKRIVELANRYGEEW